MQSLRASIAFTGVTSLLFITAACGGSSDTIDPIPHTPSARGAWSASFAPPVLNPASCPVAAHDAVMGEVTRDTQTRLENADTDLEAFADCSVLGSEAAGFAVHAHGGDFGGTLDIQIPSITSAATSAAPATGTLAFTSPKTAEPYASPPSQPCTFYFPPGTPEGVSGGRVWLSFQCPAVVGEKTAAICSVTQGIAAFVGCDGR